jgi:hypothetical protein
LDRFASLAMTLIVCLQRVEDCFASLAIFAVAKLACASR